MHEDSYATRIRRVAGDLGQPGRIDQLGFDLEDYMSELRLVSWEAQDQFRRRYGFCEPAERRYVTKALWNYARDRKALQRVRERAQNQLEFTRHLTFEAICPESNLDARESIRILQRKLPPSDFLDLVRVFESGHASEAYTGPDEEGCSYQNFCRRIAALKKRAREILE